MSRLREMPQVDVQIVQSGATIGGIGQGGVPPLAPALAYAYFRLTGKRVRSLPMFPTGGSWSTLRPKMIQVQERAGASRRLLFLVPHDSVETVLGLPWD